MPESTVIKVVGCKVQERGLKKITALFFFFTIALGSYFYFSSSREIPYFRGNPNPSICLENVESINFVHWTPDWGNIQVAPPKHDNEKIQKEIERLQSQVLDAPNEILKVTDVSALFPTMADTFSIIVYEDENAVLRSFVLLHDTTERSQQYAGRMFREGNHPLQTAPRILGISLDVDHSVDQSAQNSETVKFYRLVGYVDMLSKLARAECTQAPHVHNVPNELVKYSETGS